MFERPNKPEREESVPVPPQQLLPLQYEAAAVYHNDKGQVFLIAASSPDLEAAQAYIGKLRVFLDVVPGSDMPETVSEATPGKSRAEQFNKTNLARAVSVRIQVLEAGGIEPPYTVRFVIDPDISVTDSGVHSYNYTARWISVTVTANAGSQRARLNRGSSTVAGPVSVDNLPETAVSRSRQLDGSAGGAVIFTVTLTGSGNYTLSGSYGT